MNTLTDMPTNYTAVLTRLIGKDEVEIGNNTVATWSTVDSGLSILLHGHEIIRLQENGDVYVRHCGYPTRTTMDRLNRFLPSNARAAIRGGEAFVEFRYGDNKWPVAIPLQNEEWLVVRGE